MFDIGMTELLLIGVVALIVVGPKDLPGMFRTLGRFTARARALGREFTSAMNAAADESGVKGAVDGLKAVSNPKKFGLDTLNDAADKFDKWDPSKSTGKDTGKDTGDSAQPALDPERAEKANKIHEATAKMAQARLDREAAAKAEASGAGAAKTTAAKSTAAKKPATKTPAAKKPAAKKPATKKPASKGATARSATTKTTSKNTTTKKTAGKKTTGKKAPDA
ncbi:MAG: Sec-independent protein translocase protein TatB [Maritimibacter sp.]